MAAVVSIARGYDASYPFKTIGAAGRPGHHSGARGGLLPVRSGEGQPVVCTCGRGWRLDGRSG
jgi:hypothetical protein